MKNTLLWGALFSLICTQANADATQQVVQSSSFDNAPTQANAQTDVVKQICTTQLSRVFH